MSYFPPETPGVWSLWAQGAEEGKQNPHEGLSGRSVLEEGHEENTITTTAAIFMLVQKKDIVIPASQSPPPVCQKFNFKALKICFFLFLP